MRCVEGGFSKDKLLTVSITCTFILHPVFGWVLLVLLVYDLYAHDPRVFMSVHFRC